MKRLRNKSGLPDDMVQQVVDWIAEDLGIAGFDVECRTLQKSGILAGKAYTRGSSWHNTARAFVTLRIAPERITVTEGLGFVPKAWRGKAARAGRHLQEINRYPATITPYQYRHHKGCLVCIGNRVEALVYVAAHELRHLWQDARTKDNKKSKPLPVYHGSRGKFSEVDTESYALHMLRRWRRTASPVVARDTVRKWRGTTKDRSRQTDSVAYSVKP